MNKLIYWFLLKIKVIRMAEQFITFNDGVSEVVDESQILTIIISDSSIIVVYRNGAHDKYPATSKNLDTAYRIMNRLKLKI